MTNDAISCVFVGGPLDGRRITVDRLCASHWCECDGAVHVYHRRCHPSALLPPDPRRVVVPSPPLFDYQPNLTRSTNP